MAMAIPPSDMMFDEMPVPFMKRNAPRTASGSGMVTTRMLRKCQRNRTCARVTRMISSIKAWRSVSTA